MSHSIAIRHPRPPRHLRLRAHPWLLGLLLGVVLGALGLAIAAAAIDVVRSALTSPNGSEVPAAAQAYPGPELPPEWRRWKIGADVDHMYGGRPVRRSPWIRPNGRR